jgi:hypothetical protein
MKFQIAVHDYIDFSCFSQMVDTGILATLLYEKLREFYAVFPQLQDRLLYEISTSVFLLAWQR